MLRKDVWLSTGLISLALLSVTQGWAQTPPQAKAKRSGDTTGLNCSPAQIEHNRELAKLFREDGDPDAAYQQMTPTYIQHNPMAFRIGEVNGVHGRDEFKLMTDMKKKGMAGPPPLLPGQPPEDTYHFVMANCNYVLLLKRTFPPDPQNPGKYYEAFSFDLWRVENGKLAEHWDDARIPQHVPEVIQKPVKDLQPPPKPAQ
jgi:predicted SnoaL-like aldol condensation-catalyzing enzyme